MFRDPGIDLTTKPILEQMRQMAPCRFGLQIGNRTEFDGENTEFFNLLGLPNELIIKVFSLLSMRDRLRARVNMKLNRIEAESKYYVKYLTLEQIREGSEASFSQDEIPRYHQYAIFSGKNSYPYEFVKKISENCSIGQLDLIISDGSGYFHGQLEFFYLIRKFKNLECLTVIFGSLFLEETLMNDSFFLDVVKVCKTLVLYTMSFISDDAILKLYKNMVEGSTNFRMLKCMNINFFVLTAFLGSIGIAILEDMGNDAIDYDDRFFSIRDIEAFKTVENEEDIFIIFDGNIEIAFTLPFRDIDGDSHDLPDGSFQLKLHETKEFLENAQNDQGLIGIRVDKPQHYHLDPSSVFSGLFGPCSVTSM